MPRRALHADAALPIIRSGERLSGNEVASSRRLRARNMKGIIVDSFVAIRLHNSLLTIDQHCLVSPE
jgi:hypothetical protein